MDPQGEHTGGGARLTDASRAGLYACDEATAEAVAREALAAGLRVVGIDLEHATGRAALLDAFADALELPEYFGGNWDALDECLRERSLLADGEATAGGLLLRLHGSDRAAIAAPDAFQTLLEILDDAVEDWRDRDVPCWVLAVTESPGDIGVEPLPGGTTRAAS
jgi:hypothetical protein